MLVIFILFTATFILTAWLYSLIIIFLRINKKIIFIEQYERTIRLSYLIPLLLILSFILLAGVGFDCVYGGDGLCENKLLPYILIGLNLPFTILFIVNALRLLKPFKIIFIVALLLLISLVSPLIITIRNLREKQENNELFLTAVSTNEPNECEKLPNLEVARCLLRFAQNNPKLIDDLLCEKISKYDTEQGVICFYQIGDCVKVMKYANPNSFVNGSSCFAHLAVESKNPVYCNDILTVKPGYFYWSADCYLRLFQATGDLKYCKVILDMLGEASMKNNFTYSTACKDLFKL